MPHLPASLCIILLAIVGGKAVAEEPITRVACGSCYRPRLDRGIWKTIGETRPQLFLFMGDNIYADTVDMAIMEKRYRELTNLPAYQALQRSCRVLPIWDDHDFGSNDAGASYPKRKESRDQFLKAYPFPADHPIHDQAGVYHSWRGGPPGKRLQVILLDTRYFRSNLIEKRINRRKTLAPNTAPDATILGPAQWEWLDRELQKPADLRFIVSSIQVLATEHRFEKWSNFPVERQRLLNLLKTRKTERVVLFSGDRHLAEIASLPVRDSELPYPLMELTASGMTHAGAPPNANRYRIGKPWLNLNFGEAAIAWEGKVPSVTLRIRDLKGKIVREQEVNFPK